MAHNGNSFDHPFLEAAYERHSLTTIGNPWLTDEVFVPKTKTRNLQHLAADHLISFHFVTEPYSMCYHAEDRNNTVSSADHFQGRRNPHSTYRPL